ncbi:MAG: hypothetical protein JWO20_67 [Candidatus Angelobacter sp.]|nr:hypothetical protein [Candidatus Angelobacter sp.]
MSFWQITKEQKLQVISGFQLAGGILLGWALIGCLIVGCGAAFGTIRQSNLSSLSRPGAFAVALGSFVLISLMVQRWAKYFAGWVGYGVLNSLTMAFSGHALNNRSIPVNRWLALSMALMFFTSSVACLRFTKSYELNLLDKCAVLFWILAVTFAVNSELAKRPELGSIALAISCLVLLAAWFYQRSASSRKWVHRKLSSNLASQQPV